MTETPDTLRIAIAQLNPVVGDIAGNLEKARQAHAEARRQKVDLVLFTELFICGYPPEDLVSRPAFVDSCMKAVEELAEETGGNSPAILTGSPMCDETGVYNAVAMLDEGKVKAWRMKMNLPNYGVFDEKRLFDPGSMPDPLNFRGVRLGIPVCEDIWKGDICRTLAEDGAEILLAVNSSPYRREKMENRHQIVIRQVTESGLPMIYANQLGGQDELVFDGGSFVMNADHRPAVQLNQFKEAVVSTVWHRSNKGWVCDRGTLSRLPGQKECDWRACVMGLRDYVNKNGFSDIVLGLSGGVDSALCAAMAVDALGRENVRCVMMPHEYTSEESLKDAADCARGLGVRYEVIPIGDLVRAMTEALGDLFEDAKPNVTEENLQSRIRGTVLMAISNKFGSMVVTTGNKSEISVGYATLYGDMNGGFNPVKDLYKTQVYALSHWRNSHYPDSCFGPAGRVIPQAIIDREPSAELAHGQKDSDKLPEYTKLDDILQGLVEEGLGIDEIVKKGHEYEMVKYVERLLYTSEHKRRQSAPGVRLSGKGFGRDWRYPITNKFRDVG